MDELCQMCHELRGNHHVSCALYAKPGPRNDPRPVSYDPDYCKQVAAARPQVDRWLMLVHKQLVRTAAMRIQWPRTTDMLDVLCRIEAWPEVGADY